MLKAILFDFDGVIVESVDIKTSAFKALFKNERENDLAAIVDYHKKHGGISRTNKIIHYYKNILNRKLSDSRLKELEDRFSQYVKEAVIQAPFVEGVLEFITENSDNYDFYIISGTPHNELLEIVSRKDLSRYFSGVHGSPPGKAELIRSLLSDKGYQKDDTIFIGDSADDLEGAAASGIRFVARIDPSRKDTVFEIIDFPAINNFNGFETVLSQLNTQ